MDWKQLHLDGNSSSMYMHVTVQNLDLHVMHNQANDIDENFDILLLLIIYRCLSYKTTKIVI